MADDTETCPTCDGSGTIMDGNRKCPDCDGTGEVPAGGERAARLVAYGAQVRAKYNADQLKALQAKGHTLPGTTSYPIDDAEDLENAIHAVGRGGADHNAIRKYVIARAKALGLSSKIPDNWNADGSLKTADSATLGGEDRGLPTQQDAEVAYALSSAKAAISRVKAAQLQDPDNGTDPDDAAVMAQIEAADAAIEKAISAQTKDGNIDQPESKSAPSWATAKRAFSTFVEQPPARVAPLEVRMESDSSPTTAQFVGYASTTNERYPVTDWLGVYNETMMPGFSTKSLRESGAIPLLFNHDGMPIASTGSGTQRLSEDAKGLRTEAQLDRRQGLTNDLCIGLQRHDIDKMSLSFRAVKDTWNDAYDDRQVNEAQIYDTSIVTYPANPGTSGELLDAMRSAMGREGVGLMWSLRSALPGVIEARDKLPEAADDAIEQALKALIGADETLCRSRGPQGRARTFLVAHAMLEVRAGAVLSTANKALLTNALDALSAADKQHAKLAGLHQKAAGAVSDVLNSASAKDAAANGDSQGLNGNQGPDNGNPINPQDGAGPRSARALQLAREREAELRRLRG